MLRYLAQASLLSPSARYYQKFSFWRAVDKCDTMSSTLPYQLLSLCIKSLIPPVMPTFNSILTSTQSSEGLRALEGKEEESELGLGLGLPGQSIGRSVWG